MGGEIFRRSQHLIDDHRSVRQLHGVAHRLAVLHRAVVFVRNIAFFVLDLLLTILRRRPLEVLNFDGHSGTAFCAGHPLQVYFGTDDAGFEQALILNGLHRQHQLRLLLVEQRTLQNLGAGTFAVVRLHLRFVRLLRQLGIDLPLRQFGFVLVAVGLIDHNVVGRHAGWKRLTRTADVFNLNAFALNVLCIDGNKRQCSKG